ncbi:aspartate 1-decarboxylase [Paenibacillus sp. MCAF20]
MPGDQVIIISYASMSNEEAKAHKPIVTILDADNKPLRSLTEELHSTIL